MNRAYRIIFMGTPEFSVPVLKALHESPHEILLVVTQPDRPKGRGQKMMPPPVKQTAIELGYQVIQPVSITSEAFIQEIEQYVPDFLVVVAFGHILPERILNIPKKGAVNIHASLLPKYRGPAPIQWAIINMETETGVTIMKMDKGMDTGDILLTEKIQISHNETTQSLHHRLSVLGANLLIQALHRYEELTPIPQNHDQATYAPMLKKSDGRIDWKQSATVLDAFIRGMNPWPGAFTYHDHKRLKIFQATTVLTPELSAPGQILEATGDRLIVATGKHALMIHEIQSESGKRLPTKEFLRGYHLPPGTILQ